VSNSLVYLMTKIVLYPLGSRSCSYIRGSEILVLLHTPIADIWILVPPHGNDLGWPAITMSVYLCTRLVNCGRDLHLETTQVSKLRLGVSTGHASVENYAPN